MTFRLTYTWNFRDESYTSSYPSEIDQNNSIFKICGKNEKGKTTTLKILAFAFGTPDEDTGNINEEIIGEISGLEDGDATLSFNFVIGDKDGKLNLECKYVNRTRLFWINGNPVGETEVGDKFIVLFDVPEPLQDKLKNSIKNVRSRFKRYSDLIDLYGKRLEDLHKKLTDYTRAEDSKHNIQTAILNLKGNLSNYETQEKKILKEVEVVRKQYVLFQYDKLSNEFYDAERRLKEITVLMKKYNTHGKNVSNTATTLLEGGNQLRDMIYSSKEIFTKGITEDQRDAFYVVLKEIAALSNPDKLNQGILSSIYTFYLHQLKTAENSRSNNISDKNYKLKQELELVRRLLGVIKDYINIDAEIPGAGKKVTELLIPLEQRESKLSDLVGNDDFLNTFILKCSEIISKIGKVSIDLKKFEEHKKEKPEDENEIDIDSLKKEKDKLVDKMDLASKELEKLEDEFNSITDNEKKGLKLDPNVIHEYDKLILSRGEISKKIEDTKVSLNVQKEALKTFENISRPSGEMTLDEINGEIIIISNLKRKLSIYLNKLQNIDLRRMQLNSPDRGEGSELYFKIGEYLASVVEVIYHNKKPHKIKNIDFAAGEYILADGSGTIKFNRLGRGTRALNALLAKLRQDFHGRKKIILIDEIGDMDLENQEYLLDELKTQVKSGEALLALLTERDDSSDEVRAVPVSLD